MSYEYSEDGLVENATEEVLKALGWRVVKAWKNETFGPDGLLGRTDKSDVILKRDVLKALKALTPDLPASAYTEALYQITEKSADKTLGQINKDKHELLTKGILVSFKDA